MRIVECFAFPVDTGDASEGGDESVGSDSYHFGVDGDVGCFLGGCDGGDLDDGGCFSFA